MSNEKYLQLYDWLKMIYKEKLQKPKAPNLFEIMTADPLEIEEFNLLCESEIFKNTNFKRFILGIYTVE